MLWRVILHPSCSGIVLNNRRYAGTGEKYFTSGILVGQNRIHECTHTHTHTHTHIHTQTPTDRYTDIQMPRRTDAHYNGCLMQLFVHHVNVSRVLHALCSCFIHASCIMFLFHTCLMHNATLPMLVSCIMFLS